MKTGLPTGWTRGSRWLAAVVLCAACANEASPGDGDSEGNGSTTAMGPGADDGGDVSIGGSGSVDETGVGMDDDMPLLTSIPTIKQGNVGAGKWVELRGVIPTSRAFDDGTTVGAMVQDPERDAWAGLRLRLSPELGTPDPGFRIDVQGTVTQDPRYGVLLRVDLYATEGAASLPRPISTRTSDIGPGGALQESLDDMVVELIAPTGETLRVVEPGGTPQQFVLEDEVVVDLAPFGVDIPVPTPDTRLLEVRGVLVLDGTRSIVWPRSGDDIVPAI